MKHNAPAIEGRFPLFEGKRLNPSSRDAGRYGHSADCPRFAEVPYDHCCPVPERPRRAMYSAPRTVCQ
ncbi:hypothetical protein [Burkholderia lata]|uniref:hypothetical protein n=1 Tax=Burkholderia lata (strain ATCC 17760 / DSM 23089 / LMG 22485 / NCIMB 9086 / R18194 / 383) TaxID=482957 RepID=UPI001C2E535E|nr:hypothetical protein [Burkholderia lata]